MNCKPTSAVLSGVERTDRLGAAEAAQQPTFSQTISEYCGKDSRKANAKFQLGSSEKVAVKFLNAAVIGQRAHAADEIRIDVFSICQQETLEQVFAGRGAAEL